MFMAFIAPRSAWHRVSAHCDCDREEALWIVVLTFGGGSLSAAGAPLPRYFDCMTNGTVVWMDRMIVGMYGLIDNCTCPR